MKAVQQSQEKAEKTSNYLGNNSQNQSNNGALIVDLMKALQKTAAKANEEPEEAIPTKQVYQTIEEDESFTIGIWL